MRSITLPATHFAAGWPTDIQYTSDELTAMGRDYAGDPTEEKLLKIIQCFHSYLLKYLAMILQGHVSMRGGEVNKDTYLLLQNFLPKGQTPSRATIGAACRTLHLAFKGMDQAEVYDQLMMCLVRAVKRYDPFYHEKVKQVVDAVDEEFYAQKFVITAQLSNRLDYDCTRYLRLLAKRGFLVPLAKKGAVTGYRTGATWPPPAEFLTGKPVGLSYFISKWFRYFLTDWINWRMGEIEAKDGILQLDHRAASIRRGDRACDPVLDTPIPHAGGDFTMAHTGRSIAADISLTKLPLDIGEITLDWVNNKTDGHFGGLTRNDRHLIYCIFVREMDWTSIASSFRMSVRDVKRWYNTLIADLRERISIRPEVAAG